MWVVTPSVSKLQSQMYGCWNGIQKPLKVLMLLPYEMRIYDL